ncbi:MAG TPA: TadE family protein [Candidatus Angelobacter sp.]|nr:TadE family protein [Candidatus Angelobacter sp.]
MGSRESGQSLVETALMVPLVLLLTFNAVNFSYFFFVAIHITAAPHMGAEYSIQGFSTPGQLNLPSAIPPSSGPDLSVSTLTYQDMAGLGGSANALVQVCTQANGVGKTAGTSLCKQVNPNSVTFTFPSPAADPEPGSFILNQVDVFYTVSPIIPAGVFGVSLTPSLQFHRSVVMRAMN